MEIDLANKGELWLMYVECIAIINISRIKVLGVSFTGKERETYEWLNSVSADQPGISERILN